MSFMSPINLSHSKTLINFKRNGYISKENNSDNIATDKVLFSSEKCWYLSYFSTKTYVVGTH